MTGKAVASDVPRHDRVVAWLHWIMFVLIATVWTIGDYASGLPRGDAKSALMRNHFALGASIVVFALFRIAWKAAHPSPPLPSSMSAREIWIAENGHRLLYVLMIVVPLAGWATVSSAGGTPKLLWLLPLPAIAPQDKSVHEILSTIHVWGAWTLAVLVVLHALAVVKHHVLDKDGMLWRMAPWSGPTT